ncbi:hypothetical protein ABK040_006911 [Willaertia magna]
MSKENTIGSEQWLKKRKEFIKKYKKITNDEMIENLIIKEKYLQNILQIPHLSTLQNSNNNNTHQQQQQQLEEKEPFLNFYIGLSSLNIPFKTLLSNTILKNSLYGTIHPFLIIGMYKMDWNDSSIISINFKKFKASNCLFVYKFYKIKGKNVNFILNKIAEINCFWNANKKFHFLNCNCHHYILDLLKNLNIDLNVEDNLVLRYLFNWFKSGTLERNVPLGFVKLFKENVKNKLEEYFQKEKLQNLLQNKLQNNNLKINNLKINNKFIERYSIKNNSIFVNDLNEIIEFLNFILKIVDKTYFEVEKDGKLLLECLECYRNGFQLRNQNYSLNDNNIIPVNQKVNNLEIMNNNVQSNHNTLNEVTINSSNSGDNEIIGNNYGGDNNSLVGGVGDAEYGIATNNTLKWNGKKYGIATNNTLKWNYSVHLHTYGVGELVIYLKEDEIISHPKNRPANNVEYHSLDKHKRWELINEAIDKNNNCRKSKHHLRQNKEDNNKEIQKSDNEIEVYNFAKDYKKYPLVFYRGVIDKSDFGSTRTKIFLPPSKKEIYGERVQECLPKKSWWEHRKGDNRKTKKEKFNELLKL